MAKRGSYISVIVGKAKIRRVYIDELIYLNADNSYTEINLSNQEVIVSSKPISHFEEKLADSLFMRINRSQLVNTQYIKELHYGKNPKILLTQKITLRPSKSRLVALKDFMLG